MISLAKISVRKINPRETAWLLWFLSIVVFVIVSFLLVFLFKVEIVNYLDATETENKSVEQQIMRNESGKKLEYLEYIIKETEIRRNQLVNKR